MLQATYIAFIHCLLHNVFPQHFLLLTHCRFTQHLHAALPSTSTDYNDYHQHLPTTSWIIYAPTLPATSTIIVTFFVMFWIIWDDLSKVVVCEFFVYGVFWRFCCYVAILCHTRNYSIQFGRAAYIRSPMQRQGRVEHTHTRPLRPFLSM